MKIDGHHVRPAAINAVTDITTSVEGVHEGTDRIVRGQFTLFIKGQQLHIYRSKRCKDDKTEKARATLWVQDQLRDIRSAVLEVLDF
jgi:hypothetical protein